MLELFRVHSDVRRNTELEHRVDELQNALQEEMNENETLKSVLKEIQDKALIESSEAQARMEEKRTLLIAMERKWVAEMEELDEKWKSKYNETKKHYELLNEEKEKYLEEVLMKSKLSLNQTLKMEHTAATSKLTASFHIRELELQGRIQTLEYTLQKTKDEALLLSKDKEERYQRNLNRVVGKQRAELDAAVADTTAELKSMLKSKDMEIKDWEDRFNVLVEGHSNKTNEIVKVNEDVVASLKASHAEQLKVERERFDQMEMLYKTNMETLTMTMEELEIENERKVKEIQEEARNYLLSEMKKLEEKHKKERETWMEEGKEIARCAERDATFRHQASLERRVRDIIASFKVHVAAYTQVAAEAEVRAAVVHGNNNTEEVRAARAEREHWVAATTAMENWADELSKERDEMIRQGVHEDQIILEQERAAQRVLRVNLQESHREELRAKDEEMNLLKRKYSDLLDEWKHRAEQEKEVAKQQEEATKASLRTALQQQSELFRHLRFIAALSVRLGTRTQRLFSTCRAFGRWRSTVATGTIQTAITDITTLEKRQILLVRWRAVGSLRTLLRRKEAVEKRYALTIWRERTSAYMQWKYDQSIAYHLFARLLRRNVAGRKQAAFSMWRNCIRSARKKETSKNTATRTIRRVAMRLARRQKAMALSKWCDIIQSRRFNQFAMKNGGRLIKRFLTRAMNRSITQRWRQWQNFVEKERFFSKELSKKIFFLKKHFARRGKSALREAFWQWKTGSILVVAHNNSQIYAIRTIFKTYIRNVNRKIRFAFMKWLKSCEKKNRKEKLQCRCLVQLDRMGKRNLKVMRYRAFQRWYDVILFNRKLAKRRKTALFLLQSIERRQLKGNISYAWRRWRFASIRLQNSENYRKASMYLFRSSLLRWNKQLKSNAFNTMRSAIAESKKMEQLRKHSGYYLRRTIRHLLHSSLHRAFGKWRIILYLNVNKSASKKWSVKLLRSILSRALYYKKNRAFRAWFDYTSHCKRICVVQKNAIRRLRSVQLASAFASIRDNALRRRSIKHGTKRVDRIFMRWQHVALSRAFTKWKESFQDFEISQVIASEAIKRMNAMIRGANTIRLLRAWTSWIGATQYIGSKVSKASYVRQAKLTRIESRLRYCLLALIRDRFSWAFSTWKLFSMKNQCNEKVEEIKKTVASRAIQSIRRRTEARALHTWKAMIVTRRKQRYSLQILIGYVTSKTKRLLYRSWRKWIVVGLTLQHQKKIESFAVKLIRASLIRIKHSRLLRCWRKWCEVVRGYSGHQIGFLRSELAAVEDREMNMYDILLEERRTRVRRVLLRRLEACTTLPAFQIWKQRACFFTFHQRQKLISRLEKYLYKCIRHSLNNSFQNWKDIVKLFHQKNKAAQRWLIKAMYLKRREAFRLWSLHIRVKRQFDIQNGQRKRAARKWVRKLCFTQLQVSFCMWKESNRHTLRRRSLLYRLLLSLSNTKLQRSFLKWKVTSKKLSCAQNFARKWIRHSFHTKINAAFQSWIVYVVHKQTNYDFEMKEKVLKQTEIIHKLRIVLDKSMRRRATLRGICVLAVKQMFLARGLLQLCRKTGGDVRLRLNENIQRNGFGFGSFDLTGAESSKFLVGKFGVGWWQSTYLKALEDAKEKGNSFLSSGSFSFHSDLDLNDDDDDDDDDKSLFVSARVHVPREKVAMARTREGKVRDIDQKPEYTVRKIRRKKKPWIPAGKHVTKSSFSLEHEMQKSKRKRKKKSLHGEIEQFSPKQVRPPTTTLHIDETLHSESNSHNFSFQEKRYDSKLDGFFTRQEFEKLYGGSSEWHASAMDEDSKESLENSQALLNSRLSPQH
eukprot:g3695.t1